MGRKLGAVPLLGGGTGSHLTQSMAWAEAYLRTKRHLDRSPFDPAIWPQQIGLWAANWGLCPYGEGELGPHLTQCDRGRGLPYLCAKFHLDS